MVLLSRFLSVAYLVCSIVLVLCVLVVGLFVLGSAFVWILCLVFVNLLVCLVG